MMHGHQAIFVKTLTEWARDKNIILLAMPPHCSRVHNSVDFGCFGPLQAVKSKEYLIFSRLNHIGIICSVWHVKYAFSPLNL